MYCFIMHDRIIPCPICVNYSPETAKISGNNCEKLNRLYTLLFVMKCPETDISGLTKIIHYLK